MLAGSTADSVDNAIGTCQLAIELQNVSPYQHDLLSMGKSN